MNKGSLFLHILPRIWCQLFSWSCFLKWRPWYVCSAIPAPAVYCIYNIYSLHWVMIEFLMVLGTGTNCSSIKWLKVGSQVCHETCDGQISSWITLAELEMIYTFSKCQPFPHRHPLFSLKKSAGPNKHWRFMRSVSIAMNNWLYLIVSITLKYRFSKTEIIKDPSRNRNGILPSVSMETKLLVFSVWFLLAVAETTLAVLV